MANDDLTALVEDATFDFTMGDNAEALRKLDAVLEQDEACFEAWHARAEIFFEERKLDDALAAAERALALRPDDLHINTSLSRIWVERGDKDKAEHYNAQARMLGWKEQLNTDPEDDD